MAGGWDPSLVDPTDVVFDGLILRSVGGRTGEVTLENGQKIRFPFKAQQEITDSLPPRIQAYETDVFDTHELTLTVDGANFPGMFYGQMRINSTFADDATGLAGARGEPILVLESGGLTGSTEGQIVLSGDATGNGIIALNGDVTIPASTGSLSVDTIENTVGNMTITSSEDLTLSTTGAGDNILIDSAGTLTLNSAGLLTIQPDANVGLALTTTGTGDINLLSSDDIGITATDTLGITADVLTLTGTTTLTIGATTGALNLGGYAYPRGAWTPYTPTLSGTGTALGNGTLAGYYSREGGSKLHLRVRFTLGTTSTVGTTISFALPSGMTAVTETDGFQMFVGMERDTGTVEYLGIFRATSAGTSIVAYCVGTGGSYATVNAVSSTVPHTWASTDVLSFVGCIEINP